MEFNPRDIVILILLFLLGSCKSCNCEKEKEVVFIKKPNETLEEESKNILDDETIERQFEKSVD